MITMLGDELHGATFEVMMRALSVSTLELFDAYGIVLEPLAEPPRTNESIESIAAIIGFAGEAVRGAIVLATSLDTVHHWRSDVDDTSASVGDTMGEFANMLLGRLKASLSLEGLPILVSTPTTARGKGLSVERPDHHRSRALEFVGPGWRIEVRLEVSFDAGFALRKRESQFAAAFAGDMMLF